MKIFSINRFELVIYKRSKWRVNRIISEPFSSEQSSEETTNEESNRAETKFNRDYSKRYSKLSTKSSRGRGTRRGGSADHFLGDRQQDRVGYIDASGLADTLPAAGKAFFADHDAAAGF